jgi:hypothetical protein
VRLDHLLSREIRVGTIGEVPTIKAPRLIARSLACPPGGMRRRVRSSEIDRDLATNTETARTFRAGIPVTLHLLRVQPPASTVSHASATRRAFSSAG